LRGPRARLWREINAAQSKPGAVLQVDFDRLDRKETFAEVGVRVYSRQPHYKPFLVARAIIELLNSLRKENEMLW